MHFLFAFVLVVAASVAQPKLPTTPLTIESNGKVHRFVVEVADSDAERNAGLMFRPRLGNKKGMLFDYLGPRTGIAFWMKNTPHPLDIIFVAPDGMIARIAANTTPFSETPIPSGATIRAVLEIAGGRAAKLNIKPGDRVRHKIFGDVVQ